MHGFISVSFNRVFRCAFGKKLRSSFASSTRIDVKFAPKRALLLAKISKFEFEKSLGNFLDENDLKSWMHEKGINFDHIVARHKAHYAKLLELERILTKHNLDVRVVDRNNYTTEAINWADVIFTGGGDGTFLLGASKIINQDKTIIGINTDPVFSQGYLCLPKWCSSNLSETINLLLTGNFRWYWRQRVRASLTYLKTQRIQFQSLDKYKPIDPNDFPVVDINPSDMEHHLNKCKQLFPSICKNQLVTTILPVFGLNEVYIGESLSARVSYYDISIDGGKAERHKSSGVTVCTGTGSTSWFHHINKLSIETVLNLFNIAQKVMSCEDKLSLKNNLQCYRFMDPINKLHVYNQIQSPEISESTDQDKSYLKLWTHKILDIFNKSLTFDPEEIKMAYCIRDPLCNAVFSVHCPRGYASSVLIRSLMNDAHLVFDGGITCPFSHGSIVEFTMLPSDALRCVRLELP